MKKILSCNTSIVSAMLLRDAMEKITGKHAVIIKEAAAIGKEGCMVRYGNGFPISQGYPDTQFNSPEFIEMCSNKLHSSELLRDLGVLTPVFHTEVDRFVPMKFPVLIRETLKGCGGDGIVPVESQEEFNKKWAVGKYWTPYLKVAYEVRAYVVDGDITHAYYKVPFANQVNDDTPVRSDYHYSYVDPAGRFNKLRKDVKKIMDGALGKFFSVDAGWMPDLNSYVIFELNSGSWMNKSIVKPLAAYLVKQLAKEF